jgi:hypothetical protein
LNHEKILKIKKIKELIFYKTHFNKKNTKILKKIKKKEKKREFLKQNKNIILKYFIIHFYFHFPK